MFGSAGATACAAILCLLTATGCERSDAAAPAAHTVVIDAVRFDPERVTVRRGDTVVWVNKDPFPHTVTAQGHFDSGEIPVDGSWEYVPREAGRFDYVCTLHPTMKGTLEVR